jgi:hypothetical protein
MPTMHVPLTQRDEQAGCLVCTLGMSRNDVLARRISLRTWLLGTVALKKYMFICLIDP